MKLSARDRALLGVLVVLLLCGGVYKLVLSPEQHKAAQLQSQIVTAQSALAAAQRQDVAGRAAEVALRKAQADWTAAQHAVPAVADQPALLKLLTRAAQQAHVTMQSIALSGATSGPATASTSTTAAATPTPATSGTPAPGASTTPTGPSVTSIPVALTFTGGYQALNRLIDRLDAFVMVSHGRLGVSGPLVGISNVSLGPSTSGAGSSALSIQFTASIYQRSVTTEAAG